MTPEQLAALAAEEGPEPVVNAPRYNFNFLDVVRAALDEYDPTVGRDHWRIRDSDRFARVLLTYMLAASMAQADAVLQADERAVS